MIPLRFGWLIFSDAKFVVKMTGESDENIWRSCLKGDRKAFETLYKRYYSLLYNYGCKFTADQDLVKENIQNLFLKLITNHESLAETSSVKGYLLLSFRNKLYDAFNQKRMRESQLMPFPEELLFFEKELLNFPKELQLSGNMMRLRTAFLELSPRQQEILYLYYIMEMSHDDISFTLNIRYQSCKNLLSRSILQLRQLFFEKTEAATTDNEELETYLSYAEFSDSVNWYHLVLQKNTKKRAQ